MPTRHGPMPNFPLILPFQSAYNISFVHLHLLLMLLFFWICSTLSLNGNHGSPMPPPLSSSRKRLRDWSLTIGCLPPGPCNSITDVPGVKVGHVTIVEDEPEVVRTGVTLVLPHDGNITDSACFGAIHALNGNGEVTGGSFINDFGRIQSPIALTGTYGVGAVHEGLIRLEMSLGGEVDHKLPVVAETHDGWLSCGAAFSVRPHHVLLAHENAAGGPVAEGCVGGGTGMNCHEFKGGIGTSSRRVTIGGQSFCIGVLVQANYGRRDRLCLDGIPIGKHIPVTDLPAPWEKSRMDGSIIMVAATDAPLLPIQLSRLARRMGLGLGRVGGVGETRSGDIFLAFSTANRLPPWDTDLLVSVQTLRETGMTYLYDGVIEAVEESVWNALCAAETTTGRLGRISYAIDMERVSDIIANNPM